MWKELSQSMLGFGDLIWEKEGLTPNLLKQSMCKEDVNYKSQH